GGVGGAGGKGGVGWGERHGTMDAGAYREQEVVKRDMVILGEDRERIPRPKRTATAAQAVAIQHGPDVWGGRQEVRNEDRFIESVGCHFHGKGLSRKADPNALASANAMPGGSSDRPVRC